MSGDAFGNALSPLVTPAHSPDPANWIPHRLLPWGSEIGTRVCSVVPAGFERYARVLHPAYRPPPDRMPIRWSDLAAQAGWIVHAETQWESIVDAFRKSGREPAWDKEPSLGRCPTEVMVPLRERLSEHTSTPEVIWYGMWVGFSDIAALLEGAPQFELPAREYALLEGPLAAAGDLITSPYPYPPPYPYPSGPSLWWPDDRSWCVATGIDFRWTYVGGTERCIRNLEIETRLEVLRTQPQHRGDINSDRP